MRNAFGGDDSGRRAEEFFSMTRSTGGLPPPPPPSFLGDFGTGISLGGASGLRLRMEGEIEGKAKVAGTDGKDGDVPSWTSSQLESTKEEDSKWLSMREESIIFNESYCTKKYMELTDDDQNDPDAKLLSFLDEISEDLKSKPLEKHKHKKSLDSETSWKIILGSSPSVPSADHDSDDIGKRAARQLLQQLLQLYRSPGLAFASALQKRMMVQKRMHTAYMRESMRKKQDKTSNQVSSTGSSKTPSAPFVVRLALMSTFQLLQSLESVPGINHAKLCTDILGTLIDILKTVGPLGLHDEAQDCISMVLKFILSRPEKTPQILEALTGVSVLLGDTDKLLELINILLSVKQLQTATMSEGSCADSIPKIDTWPFLQHLANHNLDITLSVMLQKAVQEFLTSNAPPEPVPTSPSANGPSVSLPSWSAIASDGTHIFILDDTNGLVKVGTGFNNSIQGHVYDCNSELKPKVASKKKRWLCCIGKFLYASSIEEETTPANPASSSEGAPAERPTSVSDDVQMENSQSATTFVSITVISCDTLQVVKSIKCCLPEVYTTSTAQKQSSNSSSSSPYTLSHSAFCSDGQFIFIQTKRETKESTTNPAPVVVSYSGSGSISSGASSPSSTKTSWWLEVFDPSVITDETAKHIKSLELFGPMPESTILPAKHTPKTSDPKGTPEPAFTAQLFEKGYPYATPMQYVVMCPPEACSSTTDFMGRVFSLDTGKHLWDVNMHTTPFGLSTCYDSVNDVLWNFSLKHSHVGWWANMGPRNKTDIIPESLFAPSLKLLTPLQTAGIILSHMERLARQHSRNETEDKNHSFDSLSHPLCLVVHPVPSFFSTIHEVLTKLVELFLHSSSNEKPLAIKMLISILRVVHCNIRSLIVEPPPSVDAELAVLLQKLRCQLVSLLSLPNSSGEADLQQVICATLASGLNLFYPTREDQRNLLLDLMSATDAQNKLIEAVFTEIGSHSLVKELLQADSNQENSAPSWERAQKITLSILDYVFSEAKQSIVTLSSLQHLISTPLVSPALRMLMAIQRELVSYPKYQHLLLQFAKYALTKSTELVNFVLTQKNTADSTRFEKNIDAAVRNSFLGNCIPSLLITLCRKQFCEHTQVAGDVLPTLLELISILGKFNDRLPNVSSCDKSYFERVQKSDEQRIVIESQHPYPHGANQVKRSVKIPGAEALCLTFSSKCRTVSSSDALQVLKGSSEPINNKPAFYETSFPTSPIVVPGNHITFDFSASTKPDSPMSPLQKSQRWGFKCVIVGVGKGASMPLIGSWILDVQCVAVLLASRITMLNVAAEPATELEKDNRFWLKDKLLLGGFVVPLSPHKPCAPPAVSPVSSAVQVSPVPSVPTASLFSEHPLGINPFISEILSGEGTGGACLQWVQAHASGRSRYSRLAKQIEQVERHVAATLIHHHKDILADELSRHRDWSPAAILPPRLIKSLSDVGTKMSQITGWVAYTLQREKEWNQSIDDKEPKKDFFERFANVPQTLKEMCEIKRVEYSSLDQNATITRLWNTLQEDIEQHKPYVPVSQVVVGRCKFLLSLVPSKRVVKPTNILRRSANLASHTQDGMEVDSIRHSTPAPVKRSNTYDPDMDKHKTKEDDPSMSQEGGMLTLLEAYKNWKQWQSEAHTDKVHRQTDPMEAVSVFLKSSVDVEKLFTCLCFQSKRAFRRLIGLQQLASLLPQGSLSCVKHQILCPISPPLAFGGHVLDNIQLAGHEAVTQARTIFHSILHTVATGLRKDETDSITKLLMLRLCSTAFVKEDATLLQNLDVFNMLELAVKKPQGLFEKACWIVFCYLCANAASWKLTATCIDSTSTVTTDDVGFQLQTSIVNLICSTLKSLYQENERESQCYDLMLLLRLFATTQAARRALSKIDNFRCLVLSVTSATSTPRQKLLALSMCKQFLPFLVDISLVEMRSVMSGILGCLGVHLMLPISAPEDTQMANVSAAPTVTTNVSTGNQTDRSQLTGSTAGDEDNQPSAAQQWHLYLISYGSSSSSSNARKLMEVCHTAGILDSFLPAAAATNSSYKRQLAEIWAKQFIESLDHGPQLLKAGSKADCDKMAKALVSDQGYAGTVLVIPAPTEATDKTSTDLRKAKLQRNNVRQEKGLYQSAQPRYGCSTAMSVASECVSLLRMLLSLQKVSSIGGGIWSTECTNLITSGMLEITPDVKYTQAESIQRGVAALAVCGGFAETLRVGGHVVISQPTATLHNKTGVVTHYTFGSSKAQVLVEGDASKISQEVDVIHLKPAPETPFVPDMLHMTPKILNHLMLLVVNIHKNAVIDLATVHTIQLYATRAVANALRDMTVQDMLFESELHSSYIAHLVECTLKGTPGRKLAELENSLMCLSERMWELSPPLHVDYQEQGMSALLPYAICPQKNELLPMSCYGGKLLGVTFRSEDFCSFEYSGVKTGRVGDPEALVMSPVPIPMDCDYYYEVTLDVADTSSILNIGLCPEGASGWGNNSYRFQGDAKKTWFSNGQRQRSNYGVPVSSKCTIGCHWSSKEKCISYTKDGKLLGPAFKHVPSMPKLVPAIGIGRGIRANVNFGSRPFKYQVSGSGSAVVLDSVAQAKKEAEDIARLEKELREEAERKKTAWLAEKKAQTDACQQLMRMGFTKEQCLFALINSGFNFSEKPKNGSMLDLVGNWMLEHIGNVSDDDLAACMAEMKKNDDEKAKEFDTTGEKTKPPSESQNKPQTSSTSVPPEITLQQCLDSFSPSESGKYQLADLYSFNDESAAFAIINKIDPWWEDEGLPEIRMFLEHDNRPAFELEENMMLLRNKLTAGKEAEVLGLILRLTSENLSYVPLIQKRFSSGAATKSIKLSQARTGATVLVSTALVDSLPTHPMWMEEMSSTLGQQGVVKFLEPREKLVLLQFHNSETAMTTEWWYPLTHLEPVALNDEFSSRSQTIQQLISEHGNLISHYSRNAILQLVAHPRIQLCLPPLELPSLLKLVSFELLDSQQSLTEPVQASVTPSSSPLSLFKGKLMTILESDTSFSKLLLGACVSTINRETTMTATKVVISPPTGGALNAEQVSFPDANEITVVFDRTCTLSSGNKAKLSIYSDEICTKLLHRYTEKDLLFPLRFRANTLFIKMETDHNPENLKYKVACIPSTFQVGLALWLADLLLDDAAKFTDIHEVCEELFTAALKYVYVSSVPFPAKEIFFNLIKKILRIANARDYVLPIQHLDRLGEEMVSLYGSDRRVTRPGLHTTYFQSLIELALISKQVWSMLPEEVRASLTPPPPVTPTPATPTEKTDSQSSVISPTVMQMSIAEATTAALASAALAASTPKTSDPILPSNLFGVKVSPDQDDTALAVALTKTLRDSVEKLEPDGADEGSEQPVDDDFALAIALSLQSVEEPKSKDDSQEPKETKDPEKAPDAQDIPSSPETMESPAVGESSSSSSSQEESAAATPGSSPANTTSPKEAEIPEVPKLMEVDASQVSNTTTPSTVPVVSTPTEAVVPQDDKKTEVSESLPKEQTTTPSPTSAESSIPPPPPPPPSSSSLKESMTGIKIGLKPQKAPFSSVANSSWFTEVTELYFFAQYLSGKVPHDSPQMLPIWKKCYEASTKETIKERIVCVEGLPTVPEESAGDIGGLLFKIFRVHCKLWGGPDWRECIWLPVDADTHKTMGYAFVEVLCSEKVKDVVRKINKTKLPEPHNSSTLKVTRFRPDLEQSNDPRVSAYCMSKLITRSKELTSPASSALETLFSIFGKQFPGMITLQELDALQLAGAGKHFTDDELAVIRKDKDLKQLAENPETFGIPLNSFKQLYINSAMVAPVETMDELFKLGFDFHLYPDHFMSVDDAVAAMSKWERSTDRLLIEIVESTYQEKEVPSPTSLPADMLLPSFGDLHKVQAPIPVTRFRFTLLKLFNSYVTAVFPLLQPSSSVPKLTTSTLASPTSAAASTTSSKLEQIESFCDLSSAVFSCGNLIFPKSKTIFFFDVLEKTGSTCPQPALAINRLKLAASKTKAASEGEEPSLRYTMFRAAFNKLRNTHPALLRCRKPAGEHHTAIKLTFRGENVEGEGGPYRQFFTEVAQELQTQYSTSLFITCPTTHMKFIPRPSFTSSEHLEMYRLVGRMMGIAVRTGIYFSLYLPAFVWKSLLDVPATLEDFGEIDESLEKGLKYVKQCSDEECADLNDLFTTVLSDKTQVELVPQGAMIALTPENRKQYLQLVEQVRLKEFAQQSQAMRQGLLDILPDRLLRILTPAELEWRVCGQPAIDVALLKRHTEYNSLISSESDVIRWFWEVLEELPQTDLRLFLRFTWAQERLPSDDADFVRTQTRLMVKPMSTTPFPTTSAPTSALAAASASPPSSPQTSDSSDSTQARQEAAQAQAQAKQDAMFPKADTCFFAFTIPAYSSKEILRERLLLAIHSDSDSMNADTTHRGDQFMEPGRRFNRFTGGSDEFVDDEEEEEEEDEQEEDEPSGDDNEASSDSNSDEGDR